VSTTMAAMKGAKRLIEDPCGKRQTPRTYEKWAQSGSQHKADTMVTIALATYRHVVITGHPLVLARGAYLFSPIH
jgi:hypothetical protein